MAPRKSVESAEKIEIDAEGEASKSNGKESSDSDEKNGKTEEENAPMSEEEEDKDEDIANDDEDEDDESPIKKGTPKGKAKQVTKKKKSTATKATPKNSKKKSAAKKQIEEGEDEEEKDENAEYEVKEVIDSKKEKNVVYYLIRWKGYTAADDTWERATDLSCDDMIAAFNKKNQNKKASPTAAKQPPKKRKNEDVDPEKEYEVEKIISMLENKKGKVFRIRWKGFKSTQDTWEPEENLNCKDLIEKFLIKHKEQSQYSSKSLREDPKRTKRLVNETKNPRCARSSKRSSAKARKTYYSEDDNSE